VTVRWRQPQAAPEAPRLSVADFYREMLTGQRPAIGAPTYDDYRRAAGIA
jgi:hypothetical protein